MPEFEQLGVKVIALSCNSVDSHRKWIEVCFEIKKMLVVEDRLIKFIKHNNLFFRI